VTGTVAAVPGGTSTGTFSVTLAEAADNTWAGANTTITVQLLDNNMVADRCTIDANADGTPKGAVISGESDTLFATASSIPVLSMSSGDMTVTISDTYDDATELESVTISGLSATCTSAATAGTIFLKVTAGTAEILGAKVDAKGTVVAYDSAVAAATAAAFEATSTTAVPAEPADNSGVKVLIGSTSKFPLTYEATNCVSLWIGGVASGVALTIDGLGYGTDGHAYAMVNAAAADLGVARAVGTVVGQPGTTYGASLTGGCTSVTYLGSIGSVTASAALTVDTTKVVSSVASTITTADTDGQIEITEISSGYIANGSPTTITVTLTGGQFAAAPTLTTVGAAMTNLTPSYPTNTLTLYRADGTATGVSIHGTISATTLGIGQSVTASATISNGDNPTVLSSSFFVDGVLTTARTNKVITYGAATGSTTAAYTRSASSTTGAAGAVVTVTESSAATFGAGRYVAICFNDAGGDLFSTSARQIWATVSSGDLKLSGNKTTLQASTGTAAAVANVAGDFDAAVAGQCAYVQVYSASTVPSTITFTAGNAANTGAETGVGAYMTSGSAAGAMTMGVFAGSALAALTNYGLFTYGTRLATANFTVSASAIAEVSAPGSTQPYGDLTIAENRYGRFVAGQVVTVDLTNSAGSQADPVATWATSGTGAPVVTQTNAASNIVWSYAVTDGNTVTITITTASTSAAASFKVSNILVDILGTKNAGVAVANSDLYLTVAGAGISSTSYSVQAAKLKSSAAAVVTNAEVLAAIVKLIASINKQIKALQKSLKR
jgi:hypothetical protein